MKRLLVSIVVFAALLLAGREARAQNFTLTVSPSSFVFQTQDDPEAQPWCNGDILTVGYKAAGMNKKTGLDWHLAVRASDDLRLPDGTAISITNVHWTAAAPFTSGTQLTTTDQTIYIGNGNLTAVNYSTMQFILSNSWQYKAGTYTTTIIFTLSAP